ncbi:hypothetical protein HRS9139_01963 [Pyrenophora teres f. teres]|nr:hypothetical protein HRS9139_01963 [Pyrenophora teres f. teres]KAE8851702.1 hypothetical protein HRS9122_01989 [Pyrenophora teres f. teres]
MSGPLPPRAFSAPTKIPKQELQDELQAAVSSAVGGGSVKPYKKVVAMLIHFEQDDIGVIPLETELARTFNQYYGIDQIKRLEIPRKGEPVWVVQQALLELHHLGYTEKNCLVILVFSGHGQSVEADRSDIRASSWTLLLSGAMANGLSLTKALNWNIATSALDSSECDVVHILDCCYAAEACNSNAEILCASARGEETTKSLTTCFTLALITELRRLSSGPVTMGMVFSEIMLNRRSHGLLSTPFYHKKAQKDSVILPTKGRHGKNKAPQTGPNSARILVTAHVDESLARGNAEELKAWLTTMLPASVLGIDITLEGVWKSNSSIVMLSLPACVWSQLNHLNGAFTYIGEVTSRNHLLGWSAQGPALALRASPAMGLENKKPGQSSTEK